MIRGLPDDMAAGDLEVLEGSCQCKAVRYRIVGTLGDIVFCHCSMCRKAQGGAYGANAPVAIEDFVLLSGGAALVHYQSSPGKQRTFCGRCGSPIYSRANALPGVVRIRIGTLDTEPKAEPVAHIFATSRAGWDEICDDLPQYPGREPGRD